MKKIILLFTTLITILFVLPHSKINASGQNDEFVILEEGVGKQKLNPECISFERTNVLDVHIWIDGWIRIPSNTVYALYASREATGKLLGEEMISYYLSDGNTFDNVLHSQKWERGGWYAYTYIINKNNEDMYFTIPDFGIPAGLEEDEKYDRFMLQEEKDEFTRTFTGYYFFIPQSSGYKLATSDYTYVTSTRNLLTEDFFKELAIMDPVMGYTTYSMNVDVSNYKNEPGIYPIKYTIESDNGNEYTYTIHVKVVEYFEAVIEGPDEIVICMSEVNDYSFEDFASNFKGVYGEQECELFFSDYYMECFEYLLGKNDYMDLVLSAEFEGGTIAQKEVKLIIINDMCPEIFIRNYVLETSIVSTLSNSEILDYIRQNLGDEYVNSEITIVTNEYKNNEAKIGTYSIVYKIDTNGEIEYGNLSVKVTNNESSGVDTMLIISSIILSTAIIGFTILIVYRKRKLRKIK